RVALVPASPGDDVYRYMWEGRVRLAGGNPYLKAPDHPDLAPLRDDNWPRINHPDHRAIYPPLAQALFTAIAAVGPTPIVFKVAFVTCDVAALLMIIRWLRRRGADPRWVIVYALSPLTMWAFAHEGHYDGLVALGLAGLLMVIDDPSARLTRTRAAIGGAAWGFAVGVKVVPIVLAPWLIARLWRGGDQARLPEQEPAKLTRVLFGLGAAAFVACAPALLYIDAGSEMLAPLRGFARGFHVFDFTRQWLLAHVGVNGADWLTLVIVGALALAAAMPRIRGDLAQLLAIGPVIALAPTIHAWYLTWLLPALCGRVSWAWLSLIALSPLMLEAERMRELTGEWAAPAWVGAAMFVPFYAILAIEVARAALTRGRPVPDR
ncbi:MAG: hypothetical protein KDA32_13840, partial [Phycisphaerales bacterium]|nr:hypothetical protein [Phycisphaerales bacterium]